ncbi:MAG TPA: M48 family metalloprotease [Candidatus Dormibacteraeota bacterium]|nr:M48 family metalloprotease [Candidatus Dormibacteraeota bacterium]
MKNLLAGFLAMVLLAAPVAVRAQDPEAQIGQQVYKQLEGEGKIVKDSPYYSVLDPIAKRIAVVADPQYQYPFHFILVKEKQPNAFAVPGGNVYVTLPLMTFVQNQEELAGVLCHETSHDIHHDVMHRINVERNLSIGATLLGAIFHVNQLGAAALNLAANLQSLRFSRSIEQNADHLGAYTCSKAGYNPWGMAWLMERFQKVETSSPPEFLSDHPSDAARIEALKAEFQANPEIFGHWSPSLASAHPLPKP